ncbi:MAG: hypothetical protein KL863_12075 [Rhizobium sp.]|nr:hypothetical protein [Rhizobium sp.]
MAKSKVRYNGAKEFVELFFDGYTLQSHNSKKLVYQGAGEDGTLSRMVVGGKGFAVADGLLTGGKIGEIDFQNKKQKLLVELDGLQTDSQSFQAALGETGIQPLLHLLYSGNDKVSSNAFATTIFTGAGDDIAKYTGRGWVEFIDGPGADKFTGSKFNRSIDNAVSYADASAYGDFPAPSGITADMSTGKVIDPWGFTDKLKLINVITGTMFDDSVTSSAADERFRFRGLAGDDTFIGNTGEDTIDYRFDARHGGAGGVSVNLAEGWAIDGFGDTDTVSGIDRVIGTDGNDTIVGSAAFELLEGWLGDDTLTGGEGADIFRFRDGFGNDTITDFEIGIDRIRLNDLSDLFDEFEGVILTQVGSNTVVSIADDPDSNSITLIDIDAATLTAADFMV